ncbi:MAG: type II toxin-antitoxin system HicB family antitoxin, partial [Candidatus Methanoperedens sp.]|nr:type II toxin-antitoxin system HicB family antitoxin [Candidatus Methanoperedens sp.]
NSDDMQRIIKAEIYFDGEYYCARTLDIDVFTQGKTLDETINNLKEAVALHLEDELDYGLEGSSILAMMEVAV